MAIVLAVFLLIVGAVLMVASVVMTAVRKAVKSFLDGFPRQLQTMMAESDPKLKKSLKLLDTLPRISLAAGIGGLLLFLIGIGLIHSHIAQGILLLIAIVVGVLGYKYHDRLTPLLKKQLMDQMKTQKAKQPPLTAQQIRKNMQDARKAVQPKPTTPINRQQRREAQRKK